jgi:hypothetical protein
MIGDYRRVHRWAASEGAGEVDVLVTYRGEPVASAVVELLGVAQITDASGRTTFAAIPSGDYEVNARLGLGSQGEFTLLGHAPVTIEAGATAEVEVALLSPPPNAHIVTITGNLEIVDDEVARNTVVTYQIAEEFVLNDLQESKTITFHKCVGGEVLVRGDITATRVPFGEASVVRFDWDIKGYEWKQCTNVPESELFGHSAGGPEFLFRDDDPTEIGPTEQHVLLIDWTNDERFGGDTVKGGITFTIRESPGSADFPLEDVRALHVRGEVELIRDSTECCEEPEIVQANLDEMIVISPLNPVNQVLITTCGLSSHLQLFIRAELPGDLRTIDVQKAMQPRWTSSGCPDSWNPSETEYLQVREGELIEFEDEEYRTFSGKAFHHVKVRNLVFENIPAPAVTP